MPFLAPARSHLGLFCASLLASSAVHATQITDIHQMDLRRANANAAAVAARMGPQVSATDRHAAALDLRPGEQLSLLRSETNFAGRHYRYQQTYLGRPVEGKAIAITEDSKGRIKAMFGNLARGLQDELAASVQPRLDEKQAWERAQKHAFQPQLADRDDLPKSTQHWAFTRPKISQVVLIANGKPHLAYKVTFLADGPGPNPSLELSVVIDAVSGAPLARWRQSANAEIGTGPGGNHGTGLYEYGIGRSYLDVSKKDSQCFLRNKDVRTMDFNNLKWFGKVVAFPCPRHDDGEETNGAYSPTNDAHYGGTVTFDMFRDYLGVVPWPQQLPIKTHWSWNFSNGLWRDGAVHLGDGNEENYPWVALDIVAHEIAHGYTEWHSGLMLNGKQSNAINESFSDMTSEATELFVNGSNDFEFGKQTRKSGVPIRFMHNPKRIAGHIDHAADFTEPVMKAHRAAGVFNKAFHLLATTPGWGTKKAFQVFAFANAWHWTPESTFNQAACGVEFAAEEYSMPRDDVTAAFSAVGVSCGLVWNKRTAIEVWGGPLPVFSKDRKTISTDQEPADGEIGVASRTSISRNSGKRYAEFKFEKQRNAQVYQYSGGICLSLRLDSTPIYSPFPECAEKGEWSIRWFADAETSPKARINPFFRANTRILWGYSDNPGPLADWRITEGDTVGMAIDMDQGKIWYSLNGVWEGDPATGAAPAFDQSVHGEPFAGQMASLFFFSDFQEIQVKICENEAEGCHPAPAGFKRWTD